MNRGGAVFEPERAPCCQSLTISCCMSTSVMRWVRSGGAQHLQAERHVRLPPVQQRWGAAEHGPVGVD